MKIVCLLLLLALPLHAKPLQLTVGAESAIMINAQTGQVLFEKNAYTQRYPASTTKIATALLALRKAGNQLDSRFVADRESLGSITPQAKKQSNYRSPPHWLETDGTHMGIKFGEELTLHDLLHGLLIASANDAANIIATNLGGTIPQYMDELNAYLKSIGCSQTNFNNPHGLHHPEHVSTAYDLALMAKEGLKDPLFRKIVSTPRYICPQTNLQEERTLVQGNALLKKGAHNYPLAIGIKTGYHQAAGKNLVAAARCADREVIVVAMGYRGPKAELYDDVIKMFEAARSEQKMRRTLLPKGQQKLTIKIAGGNASLKTYLADPLCYDFYPTEEAPVKVSAKWEIPPLPISRGTCVGKVKVINQQGTILQEAPLLALEEVKPTMWYRVRSFFSAGSLGRKLAFGAASAAVLLFLFSLRRPRRR